jgi:hypothetical protein
MLFTPRFFLFLKTMFFRIITKSQVLRALDDVSTRCQSMVLFLLTGLAGRRPLNLAESLVVVVVVPIHYIVIIVVIIVIHIRIALRQVLFRLFYGCGGGLEHGFCGGMIPVGWWWWCLVLFMLLLLSVPETRRLTTLDQRDGHVQDSGD